MKLPRRLARLPRQIPRVRRRPTLALRLAVRGFYRRAHSRVMSAPFAAAVVPLFGAAIAYSLGDIPGAHLAATVISWAMWRAALAV